MRPILRLTLLVTLNVGSANIAIAGPCDAILASGIRDEHQTLRADSQYSLVKQAYCRSDSKDLQTGGEYQGIKGHLNTKQKSDFCNSNYNEYLRNTLFIDLVSEASPVIANAWSNCMRMQKGLIHYVTPTDDPASFTYTIQFQSDGEPYETIITSWGISSGTYCDLTIAPNDTIGSGRKVLQCMRDDPAKQVIITVNAKSGTANTERIVLPAYHEPPPPPEPVWVSHQFNNEHAGIVPWINNNCRPSDSSGFRNVEIVNYGASEDYAYRIKFECRQDMSSEYRWTRGAGPDQVDIGVIIGSGGETPLTISKTQAGAAE